MPSEVTPVDEVEPPPAALISEPESVKEPAIRTPPANQDSGAFDTVDEQVQKLVSQARVSFNTGQYDTAIRALQSAYKLKPNANYLFSIAQCHRRSGRNRDALIIYQRFLKESPNTSLKLETINYISELQIVVAQEDAVEKEKQRPVWKKGWFWGVLASSTVAVGLSLGLGLGIGLRDNTETISFRFQTISTSGALIIAPLTR